MHTYCASRAHSSSGFCASYAHDFDDPFVHDAHMDTEWFKEAKRTAKVTDAQLAEAMGVERSVVNKIINGKVTFDARKAGAVAKALGVSTDLVLSRAGIRHDGSIVDAKGSYTGVEPDQPPMRTADGGETAPVLRLNLSYSMGPGTNLDDSYYVESEAVEFDIGFLRTMTISPPSRIRIVDGIGDSMTPTLHDRDLLFVDINQRDLNAQDRIWAVWIYGLGAVKRLRAIGPDKVLVISDNPDVKDQEVSRQDIMIHGRVIGSIKRH